MPAPFQVQIWPTPIRHKVALPGALGLPHEVMPRDTGAPCSGADPRAVR